MSVATHPIRIAVLKSVRAYFKEHNLHAETCSSKAYITDDNGMPAICPKAIGTSTMVFRKWYVNPFTSRKIGRATCKLSNDECTQHVNAVQAILGDDFVVYAGNETLHIETNPK